MRFVTAFLNSMPKIVLIRHVTPLVDGSKCNATVAQNRLVEYNETESLALDEINSFKQSTSYQNILTIQKIFVSPLIRAQKTANALFPDHELITLEELKEFDLKITNMPKIKLTLNSWFMLSRILWLLGLNKTQKKIGEEKKRVKKLIPTLLKQDCCIVSHGFIQHEIKNYLKKNQFVKSFHQKNGCFSVEIFQNSAFKQNINL
ncbi:histidine phosphatase family protein [Aggregatibacter actinomycetemcomitans]|nr:histidine phosphatase family protein [Aggregatibacter actinomycetemcomitans]MBN6064575.1 histidine phosphatase family protein [Aggregatibacter actinomycetemcomitans]MBN6080405.1 histidine phosphatase family protein [Aggregatibacter actinomycetemcomitans]MBN6081196.1 histidine phosphatase family protein [Aggregatibacter actinomycetemcomitans]MBN6084706.1 histidine phosphatase family protein [Aggregatibacter actinomycetemcomitans]